MLELLAKTFGAERASGADLVMPRRSCGPSARE